jgi:hypothetical protein
MPAKCIHRGFKGFLDQQRHVIVLRRSAHGANSRHEWRFHQAEQELDVLGTIWRKSQSVPVKLNLPRSLVRQVRQTDKSGVFPDKVWLFQDDVYIVNDDYSEEEQQLLVLEEADKERELFERLRTKHNFFWVNPQLCWGTQKV